MDEDQRLDAMHADLCKVFSNPVRLGLLRRLRERESSVRKLSEAMGLSQPTISKHLGLMRARGVLRSRREGTTVFYRAENPKVLQAFDLMRAVMIEQIRANRRLLDRTRRGRNS
ncbi:MAG: ArsR/SmtB family transcription factor [Thermoplasmata archaeon]